MLLPVRSRFDAPRVPLALARMRVLGVVMTRCARRLDGARRPSERMAVPPQSVARYCGARPKARGPRDGGL
jgi:hypothetical protein